MAIGRSSEYHLSIDNIKSASHTSTVRPTDLQELINGDDDAGLQRLGARRSHRSQIIVRAHTAERQPQDGSPATFETFAYRNSSMEMTTPVYSNAGQDESSLGRMQFPMERRYGLDASALPTPNNAK